MKNDYEIRGDVVAIKLSHKEAGELETLISINKLELLLSVPYKWYAVWHRNTGSYYCQAKCRVSKGEWTNLPLHRFVMGFPDGYTVDHINNDTLNNTDENLRIVTQAQNHQNRAGANRNSTTGIRGVYWNKKDQRWTAQLRSNGKTIRAGSFLNIQDAEAAVKEARAKHMPYSKEALNY